MLLFRRRERSFYLMGLSLVLPTPAHKPEWLRVMDRWEATGEYIAPSSLSRYSAKLGQNVTYERWLAWMEDDRTTASMLTNNIPSHLFFLVNAQGEILGATRIDREISLRGNIHAGIVPWERGKGYGTKMLALALHKCREFGFDRAVIVPRADNLGAIQTVIHNGGRITESFSHNGEELVKFEIEL
jgi:predicted acetyltransferase